MRARLAWLVPTLTLLGVVACAGEGAEADETSAAASALQRDWNRHPGIVEIDDAREIFALSDPHGSYEELGALLEGVGLIKGFMKNPKRAKDAKWAGGDAHLVVAGDLIDKGADSVAVIELMRAVQASAPAKHVVVTMGNHEAEFLGDPSNKKATERGVGFAPQLSAQGINPADVAAARDAGGIGAWLRDLPFGVRIKKWYFSHSGDTRGKTIRELATFIRVEVDKNGFLDKDIIDDKTGILDAERWYEATPNTARDNAKALGVKHIAFGHDPGALATRGQIEDAQKHVLIKLNVNMGMKSESTANRRGEILHATIVSDGDDRAEVIGADGKRRALF